MSLIAKLTQSWQDDNDSLQDAIVDNICDLISGRAPIWQNESSSELLNGTIVHMGVHNAIASLDKIRRDGILSDINELIRFYEPRLSDVLIEPINEKYTQNQLQFRISAIMHTPLGEEAVVLDSSLDLNSSKLDVRKTTLV